MRILKQFARTAFNLSNLKKLALLFFMNFIINQYSYGQKSAIDIVKTGIQIGQQVPDVALNNLSNYTDASGKLSTTAKLSDFKGKLVILDFWATWCAPCVAMIPRMDSLQTQFNGKLKFISVAYQSEKEVLPFLTKLEKRNNKKFNITNLSGSKVLEKLFPHIYLPHYVWIDGGGVVRAITGYKEINVATINLALGKGYSVAQKKDFKTTIDDSKPFLINGNGGNGDNLMYHSILTGYTDGLIAGGSFKNPDSLQPAKIIFRNTSLSHLLKHAYGEGKVIYGRNRMQLLVKDTSKLVYDVYQPYQEWVRKNKFCYELIVPYKLAANRFKMMQNDLSRFFTDYKFSVEKQVKKCWVLIRTSTEDKIASAGGDYKYASNQFGFKMQNHALWRFVSDLNALYMQNSDYPVINQTDYKGFVDIEVQARMGNITELNKGLAKYDLAFILKEVEIDVIVVRDAVN
ncbi:TlpA disulfide reductase family protein [Pedobacter sp. Du54]|uniref:TlpA family protein disulfide reductase n=1 Tax=Pedobacter anseongensis TaxID=3133439 RepID=UPI0030AB27F3